MNQTYSDGELFEVNEILRAMVKWFKHVEWMQVYDSMYYYVLLHYYS